MISSLKTRTLPLLTIIGASFFAAPVAAQEKTEFNVAWSIYVSWMPWGYAEDTGIVDRWADKYGITINVTRFNDYVESINQYTAGAYPCADAAALACPADDSGDGHA